MTTLTLSDVIGKTGSLLETARPALKGPSLLHEQDFQVLRFHVRIIDAKMAYGNLRYQVTPVAGTGSVWVDSSRVQIDAVQSLSVSVPA